MEKIQKILNQSLAIRTFPIREIERTVESYKFNNHTAVHKHQSRIVDYLKPYCDLSDFDYFYPLNGITEGLNYWMWQEKRSIKMAVDDYQWVSGKETGEVLYLSNPTSYDGNYCTIPTDIPVVLDLAYLLSTEKKYINISSNVERVFFSFSKCFGLRNYRIGYYWSRTPDKRLEPLHTSAKYYNYYSMGLGEHLMQNIDSDLVYNTLKPYQLSICNELDLTPSDAIWLATSDDLCYSKFKRNYTNRLCIADLIKEQYHAT